MSTIHDGSARGDRDSRHEPISWLVLESYALGELDPDEAARVAARIAEDEETQRCLAMIREQEGRVLPPLLAMTEPVEVDAAPGSSRLQALLDWLRDRLGGRRMAWAAGVVAFACLALLLYSRGGRDSGLPASEWPGPRAVIKGDDIIALGLVRERNGSMAHDPASFATGDRFQVLVTCPPTYDLRGELVVYQDGEASFPRPPIRDLTCGNRVTLPGAFRLTGNAPATICLVYSDGSRAVEPDQDTAIREDLTDGLDDRSAVCATLQPE